MKFKYTDFHVHTRWSHDIANFGPTFQDYAKIAEENEINICFLDHYELYYVENDESYPFYGGKLDEYLEEIDEVKATHDFVLSGLEVDYYRNYKSELREFMDDYKNEFDFIAGTVHETCIGLPITTRKKLIELLKKKKIKEVVDDFFALSKELIESRIFTNICHLDTIFRYINMRDLIPSIDTNVSEERVLELGRACIKNDVRIEYNLSGRYYPIRRPFPSQEVITQLIKEGARIFIGSDSHSLEHFKENISEVVNAYKQLDKINKIVK